MTKRRRPLRVLGALLLVAGMCLVPWLGLSLAMRTYLIVSEPHTAEFLVDGEPGAQRGSFIYWGFFGSDDIECRFKSGVVRRVRVYPRFWDDNSSSLFIHESGEVVSHGDLRFERLEPAAKTPSP